MLLASGAPDLRESHVYKGRRKGKEREKGGTPATASKPCANTHKLSSRQRKAP